MAGEQMDKTPIETKKIVIPIDALKKNDKTPENTDYIDFGEAKQRKEQLEGASKNQINTFFNTPEGKKALEDYAKEQDRSIAEKTSATTVEKPKETNISSINETIKADKSNTINMLLEKDKLSLGSLLETFGSKMKTQILESKASGKDLSKETKDQLEKELTPDRMYNMTLALSDKVISKLNDSLAKIKNNKEDGPAAEMNAFNMLKTFLQEGNVDGVAADGKLQNALKDSIVNTDPAWAEIKTIQKNMKEYVIINNASLAGFDSYANTQTILEDCKTKVPEAPTTAVEKSTATPEQMKETAKKFGELVKDIPMDEADKKELTEKGTMKKMDAFFDKNPWAKEVLGFIKDIFQGTKLGQWLSKFMGDKYGIDIDKALTRPLIQENVKTYLESITKLGDKDPALTVDTKDWKTKTDYFRLQNNIVYHKDATGVGVLESYDPTTKELTPLEADKEAETYEKNHIVKGATFSESSISQFMLSDIHPDTIVDQISAAAISKYPDKTGNNKTQIANMLGQKYKTADGRVDANKLGNDIKSIVESKKYLYSSEDLIAEVIGKNLQQLEGEKAKAPTIKVNPDALKIQKDQAITPDTLTKFFNVENGFGKTIVFTTSETPNTQNVGPQTLNINVFVNNVASVVPVTFTVEEPTPAAPAVVDKSVAATKPASTNVTKK